MSKLVKSKSSVSRRSVIVKKRRSRKPLYYILLFTLIIIIVLIFLLKNEGKSITTSSSGNISVKMDSSDSYFSSYNWDGSKTLYILFLHRIKNSSNLDVTDKIGVFKLNPSSLTASFLKIDPKMYLDVNNSKLEADLIYTLGNVQVPSQGLKFLSQGILNSFGIIVDGYVITNSNYNNLMNSLQGNDILTNLSAHSTSLWNNYLTQISPNNISNISSTPYLFKDNNGHLILNESQYDAQQANVMQDEQIANEHARIEVYNASPVNGAGASLAREISNMGGNVTRIESLSTPVGNGTTVYVSNENKFPETMFYLKKIIGDNLNLIKNPPSFFYTGDIQLVINN